MHFKSCKRYIYTLDAYPSTDYAWHQPRDPPLVGNVAGSALVNPYKISKS